MIMADSCTIIACRAATYPVSALPGTGRIRTASNCGFAGPFAHRTAALSRGALLQVRNFGPHSDRTLQLQDFLFELAFQLEQVFNPVFQEVWARGRI
jgi:hypothetical protein